MEDFFFGDSSSIVTNGRADMILSIIEFMAMLRANARSSLLSDVNVFQY